MHDLRDHLARQSVVLGVEFDHHIEGVDLIVAAPDSQRRVVAQLLDDCLRLRPHLRQELLRLWIQRTGKREVLPDHNAQLVAAVKEGMVLVNVAAPTADHVAAQVVKQG